MENEFKAIIFTPKKGFDWRLNSNRLLYGCIILIPIVLILSNFLNLSDEFIKSSVVILFVLAVVGSRWGFNEKQNPFGLLGGELVINDELISVNGKKYYWEKISDFSFGLREVVDEQLFLDMTWGAYRFYGGPSFSAGVDNYIDFNPDNEQQRVYFQLETPSQRVDLRNFLKRQFFLNNIEIVPIYNSLRLEYEEIQELKNEKREWLKAHNKR